MKLTKIISKVKTILEYEKRLQYIQEALGRIEARQIEILNKKDISESEFRVFSQWGEDGIIQFLIKNIEIDNKIFVEFGVENYKESNTRFLLINNNWSGLVLDGDRANIDYIKSDMDVYWAHNLKAECIFINRENINDILIRNGLSGDIGLLSVDIDGNDYWIWEAIECIRPRIVICEYNSIFGPNAKVTTPYKPDFVRQTSHYSNIFYGASIAAFEFLATKKGYSLVGANSAGNNVFFVRNDLCSSLTILTPEQAYRKAQFREAKNIDGNITFADFSARKMEINELEVVCVENNKLIKIKEL